MQIWIDADACLVVIKEIVYRAAEQLKITTTLVANIREHWICEILWKNSEGMRYKQVAQQHLAKRIASSHASRCVYKRTITTLSFAP